MEIETHPADRTLAELNVAQCLDYLQVTNIGRVGILVEGRVQVMPVNYTADLTGRIVFRTAPASVLNVAAGTEVTFEVDGVDPQRRTGWTVQVFGQGREITHDTGSEELNLRQQADASWAAGRTITYLISPTAMVGRELLIQLHLEDREDWFAGVPS